MKKIYLPILLLTLAVSSCDTFDKVPSSEWPSEGAIKTLEDLQFAVNGVYESQTSSNPYRWDRFSSRTIKSTDNIRLREMTVGYTLPVLKKHISNFRIYFRANNLAMLWSKTKNIDPDVAINGYRQADTPALRSCVFGINIKL